LIESIRADTGWSTSFLGAVYGAAMALTGLSAFWSGRLLDRFGPRAPLGVHAVAASGLMLAALDATNPWLFAPLFATGAGLGGSTGFYAMTTVIAARARPDRPDRAIAVLTLVGAFCSPIYLPLTAWLLTVWEWRSVGRALVLAGAVGAAQAIVFTRSSYGAYRGGSPPSGTAPSVTPSPRSIDALRRALVNPAVRRALIVYFLAGAAASTVWAYQVPILQATGLSLALAGTLAGLRGFFQVFGRMGLATAVERFGSVRLLQTAYVSTAVGILALLVGLSGSFDGGGLVIAAVVFAATAGAGFGASSPLQAIHARLHFDPGDLGLLMGLQAAVLGLAGGLGPVVGSILRDLSGGWFVTVGAVLVGLLLSAFLLGRSGEQLNPMTRHR
jgi:MFS family permease